MMMRRSLVVSLFASIGYNHAVHAQVDNNIPQAATVKMHRRQETYQNTLLRGRSKSNSNKIHTDFENIQYHPPGQIMTDGVKNIYFTTDNSTDDTKVVSRAYKANRMYSVTGGAAPPDYFAPGTSGFTVPEGEFAQNGSLNGVWYFLGQSVLVTSDLPVCADSGTPVQCTTISQAQLRVPVDYTRAMVMRLTKMAFTLAKKGKWKGLSGSFATPFLSRGAAAMASMQKTLAGISTGPVYACDSQPAASCTQVSLTGFKRIAQTNFGRLFAKPVPRGLESITRLGAQEGRAFKTKVLDQLPDQVWVCPSNVTPSGY